MTNIDHWFDNLSAAVENLPNGQAVETIFSSLLDYLLDYNVRGACHTSCGVIHILLNEAGVENTWYIGEIGIGGGFADHSWIEIDGAVFDLSIFNTDVPGVEAAPVVNGIDIETNLPTTVQYGIVTGADDSFATKTVKGLTLTEFLNRNPMSPHGAWILVERISRFDLGTPLDLPALAKKYDKSCFTEAG